MVPIARRICKRGVMLAVVLAAVAVTSVNCAQDTARLSQELEARFDGEGIVRRADNVVFRYTHGQGTHEAGWEERVASIVVTHQTIYIHKNEKVGLEINPRTRRICDVERREDRIRIHAGSGQSAEVWSFVPSTDAEGWARDLRATLPGKTHQP